MTFVPHDRISAGYWYLRTRYPPYYTIVSVTKIVLGPDAGEYGVWCFDEEGYQLLNVYGEDQFIRPVAQLFDGDKE